MSGRPTIEQDYALYAGFMAGVYAYALSSKEQYDPLRIFLSSKIDPLPYQIYDFNALMEDLRTQGSIRALIAYETGLGKTILAGMVMQEIIAIVSQFVSPKILVLTPPSVIAQFHDELKEKFAIDLDIFDSQEEQISSHSIASIDTLKFQHWREILRSREWDLVLVDELHRASPENLRGELLELLTKHTQHFMALTATPHDGKSERYEYRLGLISQKPLIIRRTKRAARDINDRPLFDQELVESTEEFDITSEEDAFYEAAEEYARERFKGSPTGALVAITIGRAVSSSIRAGVKMLARRHAKLLVPGPEASEDMIDLAREQMEAGGELSDSEIDAILSAQFLSLEERNAELAILEPVLEMGRQLIKGHPIDSKGKYFLRNIDRWLSGGHKCLVFTGFLETVNYLYEILEEKGYNPKEITSRVSLDGRKRVVKQLMRDNDTRIIIGTDAMAESLNLQAANVEVNYEVPWSPVAYIQRVGRIWRIGQMQKELHIHNFLPTFKVERRVLEVVLEKVKTINDEFGEIGLSVFTRELGRVEQLVREEYEDVESKVEDAFRRTERVGNQVLAVLNKSMTLPKVVNLEELQRGAHISFEDTFSEDDLLCFLEYLRDAGYAAGYLPDDESDQSSYHVNREGEYIQVKRVSLHDLGVQAAIEVGKAVVERNSPIIFSYHKSMAGQLALYRVTVDERTVYEEPVLVTPDGVLTYDGISSLQPYYITSQVDVSFTSLSDYVEKRRKEWLDRMLRMWESKKKDIELQILESKNEAKRESKRIMLREHVNRQPRDVKVEQAIIICDVDFDKTESEQTYLERHEVEELAMKAAIDHYRNLGFAVDDVARKNRGYDILCRSATEVVRVEVKGLLGASHPTLTEKEHRTAVHFKDGFVLFILQLGGNQEHKFAIPNPAENVTWTAHQKTEYSVSGYSEFEIH